MRFPRSLPKFTPRQTQIFDFVVAAVLVTISVQGLFAAELEGSEKSRDLLGLVLVLGQTLPFFVRRTHPLICLKFVLAFTMVFWVLDYATTFDSSLIFALYAATAFGRDRRRVRYHVLSTLAITTTVTIIGVFSPGEDLPGLAVVSIAVLFASAAAFGQIRYDQVRRLRNLELRAQHAEAELEVRARLAVVDERTRIARELHDIVSHSMSVMVVQAAAAQRVIASNPAAASEALHHIETAGRESLNEMRRMLGVLRDGDDVPNELLPQPTIEDIDALVQQCRDSDIPTILEVTGTEVTLSPGLQLTGFRLLQESLTNVMKHAGRPVKVGITIDYGGHELTITVVDDGMGAASSLSSDGAGHGLTGMRERIDLYRGHLAASPRPGGGFKVVATLPYDGAVGVDAGSGK